MNFTAAELRTQADYICGNYYTRSDMNAAIVSALREYADLKEAAEKGVSDDVVNAAYKAWHIVRYTHEGSTRKQAVQAAVTAVAPLLALKGDKT
jgi:hypothetical protein